MEKLATQETFLSWFARIFLIGCVIIARTVISIDPLETIMNLGVYFCFAVAFILFIFTVILGSMTDNNHSYGH